MKFDGSGTTCRDLALHNERIDGVLDCRSIAAVALDHVGREVGGDAEHHRLEDESIPILRWRREAD